MLGAIVFMSSAVEYLQCKYTAYLNERQLKLMDRATEKYVARIANPRLRKKRFGRRLNSASGQALSEINYNPLLQSSFVSMWSLMLMD